MQPGRLFRATAGWVDGPVRFTGSRSDSVRERLSLTKQRPKNFVLNSTNTVDVRHEHLKS